jgi:hypothetical protein
MSIKKKVAVFVIVILAIASYGNLKEYFEERNTDNRFIEWFNGWIAESTVMRKDYHIKISSLKVVEIKSSNDYFDVKRMIEYKYFIKELLKVELWKIDKTLEISNKWYNKIDPLLSESLNKEQLSYLKRYLNEGKSKGNEFRQLTKDYINDQIIFANFLLERNCKLSDTDEVRYNELVSKTTQSSTLYAKAIKDISETSIPKIKEFNSHFNNANLDKLIGVIN